jgi:hypothetical protein
MAPLRREANPGATQDRRRRIRQEGRREGVGQPQIHGEGDELRADDAGNDPAGHDGRQRARPQLGRHVIGGGGPQDVAWPPPLVDRGRQHGRGISR